MYNKRIERAELDQNKRIERKRGVRGTERV